MLANAQILQSMTTIHAKFEGCQENILKLLFVAQYYYYHMDFHVKTQIKLLDCSSSLILHYNSALFTFQNGIQQTSIFHEG